MDKNKQTNIILLVDDSDITKKLIKEYFKNSDMEIITCSDGLEGIKKALEHKPNLILLDIMMPDFDGIKMLQVIKLLDELRDIPVIVISAAANKRNVLTVTEAGADKIIPKPLEKKVLIESVENLLGISLAKSKKEKETVPLNEVDEIKIKLKHYFLQNFYQKRNAIIRGIETCNIERVKDVVHEIKGTGNIIGLPEVSVLSSQIEDKLDDYMVNWSEIEAMSTKLFSMVNTVQK
jgi:CheY-like chemotaxis protein/HPt (histidine-containing phosphotransfer) domain-containing protein